MVLALFWIIGLFGSNRFPVSCEQTTAGGSRQRSSSAPPKYQTHKEPCGFRKQELITRWFGWWFFWNGFHVWDEADMFGWWGRLGNHRPGFSLEMFMGRVVVVKTLPWINQDRSKRTGNQPKSWEISWSGKEWPNEAQRHRLENVFQAGAAMIICMVVGASLNILDILLDTWKKIRT